MMFKHAWKKLDLWSKFIGTGGPVEVGSMPAHLDRVHNGVGRVSVVQEVSGKQPVSLNLAVPLAKFSAQNGGPVMVQGKPGFPTDTDGRVPHNARFPGASGSLPPQTISPFGPVTVAMQKPGGGGPVDPFPGLTKIRDRL